ncbi:MAG: murein hydrolase activator EnvC family protein [Panacagrimonas sp.]
MPIIASPFRWRLKLAAVLLAASNVLSGPARADEAPEAALEALRSRVAELDRESAAERTQQDALRQELEEAEKVIAGAARTVRETAAAESAQRDRVLGAQVARAQVLAQTEQRRSDLAASLRASYMAGSPGRLQLMFRQDVASSVGRLDVDVAHLAQALQQQLAGLQEALGLLAQSEAALATEQDALEARNRAAREALVAVRKAQAERRTKLDELASRGSSRAAELAQARSEQARLEKLVADLRAALKASSTKFESGVPFRQLRGHLPWPVRGDLLARFGSAKNDGPLTWRGLWIKSAAGVAVRVVADGRVVYAGHLQRFGLVVIVDHPGQYLSVYGHLQEAQVEVGEPLKAGARVGTAGNSGGHEENGVYFEIREGADPIDPIAWLAP